MAAPGEGARAAATARQLAWPRKLAVAAALLASALRPGLADAQEGAIQTSHFLVYPQAGATPRQAERVGALAESAFGLVTGELGYAPRQRIAILLYGRSTAFLSPDTPPHAVGTVVTPHNVIRIDLWRAQGELRTVLAHETAHVVLARALRSDVDKCPRWFAEGLATWVSRTWSPDDDAEAQELARRSRAVAPPRLDARFSSDDPKVVSDAYRQSAAMVEQLTRLGRTDVIPDLISAMRRTPDFDAALRQTAGLTQDELYQRWLRAAGGARWPRWANIGADMVSYIVVTALVIILGIAIWRQRRRRLRYDAEEEGLTPDEIERAQEMEDLYDPRDGESY